MCIQAQQCSRKHTRDLNLKNICSTLKDVKISLKHVLTSLRDYKTNDEKFSRLVDFITLSQSSLFIYVSPRGTIHEALLFSCAQNMICVVVAVKCREKIV